MRFWCGFWQTSCPNITAWETPTDLSKEALEHFGYPWAADSPFVMALLQLPGVRDQLEHEVALFLSAYSLLFLSHGNKEGVVIWALSKQGRGRLVRGHIWNEMALRGPRVQPGSVEEETPKHIDQTKCSFVSRHMLLCRFITSQTILIKTGIISTLSSSPAWIRKQESRSVT